MKIGMSRGVLAIMAGLALTGCVSLDEQRARNAEVCVELGYPPNTPEMRECRLRLEVESRHRYGKLR